jgi:HK97 family phage prohead protease
MPEISTLRREAPACGRIEWKAFAAAPPNGDPLEYVMSDDTVDRMGDIIVPGGWSLANFRNNPMALHDHSFQIGNWSNPRVIDNRLVGKLELGPAVSEQVRQVHAFIEAGMLRAVSVGFNPIEWEPITDKAGKATGGIRFLRQELLECSVVRIPANPNALSLAKQLNLSEEEMSIVFGEHAEVRRRDMTGPGEHADTKNATGPRPSGRPSLPKAKTMTTLSQRIEAAQNDIIAKRDTLTELTKADDLDVVAIEEMNTQIEAQERGLAALQASEAKLGINAQREAGVAPQAPAIAIVARSASRRARSRASICSFVRSSVRGISHFGSGEKSLERVLDERYPGHEATAIITKADQTIGTTTVSGWAAELVRTTYADFLQALTGYSIYPALRDRGYRPELRRQRHGLYPEPDCWRCWWRVLRRRIAHPRRAHHDRGDDDDRSADGRHRAVQPQAGEAIARPRSRRWFARRSWRTRRRSSTRCCSMPIAGDTARPAGC